MANFKYVRKPRGKKTFILIALVLIALVLIGGGIYYYIKKVRVPTVEEALTPGGPCSPEGKTEEVWLCESWSGCEGGEPKAVLVEYKCVGGKWQRWRNIKSTCGGEAYNICGIPQVTTTETPPEEEGKCVLASQEVCVGNNPTDICVDKIINGKQYACTELVGNPGKQIICPGGGRPEDYDFSCPKNYSWMNKEYGVWWCFDTTRQCVPNNDTRYQCRPGTCEPEAPPQTQTPTPTPTTPIPTPTPTTPTPTPTGPTPTPTTPTPTPTTPTPTETTATPTPTTPVPTTPPPTAASEIALVWWFVVLLFALAYLEFKEGYVSSAVRYIKVSRE